MALDRLIRPLDVRFPQPVRRQIPLVCLVAVQGGVGEPAGAHIQEEDDEGEEDDFADAQREAGGGEAGRERSRRGRGAFAGSGLWGLTRGGVSTGMHA